MNISFRLFAALAALLLLAFPAFADQGPSKTDALSFTPSGPKAALELNKIEFRATDSNKDGVISKEEMQARAGAVFDILDADKDGKLTKEEFRSLPALLSITLLSKSDKPDAKSIDGFFDSIDKDHDGKITREELLSAFVMSFEKMDVNKDGKISTDEFLVFHVRLPDAKAKGGAAARK